MLKPKARHNLELQLILAVSRFGGRQEELARRRRVAQPVRKQYEGPLAVGMPPPRAQRCAPESWSNAPLAPTSRAQSRAAATGPISASGPGIFLTVEKLLHNVLPFFARIVDQTW